VSHIETVEIHGQTVTYRRAGAGPALVLIHGITSSSGTWEAAIGLLAQHFDVIAPDLVGHGESAKPRGDYSLGAHASGIRDLLAVLGVRRATVVGHSLGGGIAMQFVYQFPDRVERLVLVDSGGLGNEVSRLLRAATLPGAEYVLPVLFGAPARFVGGLVAGALRKLGKGASANARGVGEGMQSLSNPEGRRAFLHTVRSVIDPAGQRVDARDRLYLAESLPTLLIWGCEDPIIPIRHGRRAHEAMPGSRFEEFPGAGHFPFNDDPERFCAVLRDFIETTEPAVYDEERIEALLRRPPAVT
jgi:pimeloyl-ACP methyl ester carboxylesterase